MKKVKVVLFGIVLLGQSACIGGGTHGYIKAYNFPVKKEKLQEAVEEIISKGGSIYRDTPKYHIVEINDKMTDTFFDNYYNDTNNYVTIFINHANANFNYIFRYYGDETYWDTSKSSTISISYAYDEKRNGGSAGNGSVNWYHFSKKKLLVEPFELEFINKIDSLLGTKHTEE